MLMNPIIAPSMLASDFANLQSETEMVNASQAEWIHLDIMDGHFVPNLSFGLPVVEAFARHARKPLDVHLMIENPDLYLEAFKKAGASAISVHLEACTHLHRTVSAIRSMGCLAGVAVNPHSPVALLADILADIDYLCLMSVNPGFGGQQFIEHTYRKTRQLRQMAQASNPALRIEIDGGVNEDNIAPLAKAGADIFVVGSFLFKSADPIQTVSSLYDKASNALQLQHV